MQGNKLSHPDNPRACIILIGNELLSGQTQDKNLAHLARNLMKIGVKVVECRVIPDVEDVIVETLNTCRHAFDYVFTTGGIGPTHDDITAHSVAKAFGVPLIRHNDVVTTLQERMKAKFNDAALKMTDFPQGARLIENSVTAAPGFSMENVYVMAGVPDIMHVMLDSILPTLTNGKAIHSHSVFCDLPESHIASGLHKIQETYPSLEIGSYPHWPFTDYKLCLVARGTEETLVLQATDDIKALIRSLNGNIAEDMKI